MTIHKYSKPKVDPDDAIVEDYDPSEVLDSEEDIRLYLEAVVDQTRDLDDDTASSIFLDALGDAAKARRRMSTIAERADVRRESLYRSLRGDANPSFRTVFSALRELLGDPRPPQSRPHPQVA